MSRKVIFENDKYYHIYNRGTDKRKVFMDKGDLYYFLDSIIISNSIKHLYKSNNSKNARKNKKENAKNSEKIVDVIAYSLLPNHFHLILKQKVDGGISKFMQKLGTSYTKYFNQKYERSGVLFQGKFKASLLAYEGSLERTSAYVNLNYKHHNIDSTKALVKTSLFEYLGTEKGEEVCNAKEIGNIISEVGGLEKYKKLLKEYSKFFIEDHNLNPKYVEFKELEK